MLKTGPFPGVLCTSRQIDILPPDSVFKRSLTSNEVCEKVKSTRDVMSDPAFKKTNKPKTL